ncbi:MAG TPA: cytochrome c1 [Caulobacteraceae bacterium]|jgi:ubiquinol-cytochrome c reductase cytochrome c1 subunit|nr:cytochrome c1 [Caulobacteraceae bacterium]
MGRTLLLAAALSLLAAPALAATTELNPKDVHWSFEGPFGMYDQAQLQRGYKVYREVCSSCHSMNMVAFRNLGDEGGPFWNPKYPNPNDNPVVKAIAADYQIPDIDSDTGEAIKRPGTSADYFPNPYPNPVAGKAANGGALPPDMSLLAKAREGGPAYIYSIVTSDTANAPHGIAMPPGKYYDPYIAGDMSPYWKGDPKQVPPGGFIAMPPPLSAGRVQFDDGVKSSLSQEAWDVAAFLEWAADPKMEERKHVGLAAMIFLVLFSGLLWVTYRGVWRNVEH